MKRSVGLALSVASMLGVIWGGLAHWSRTLTVSTATFLPLIPLFAALAAVQAARMRERTAVPLLPALLLAAGPSVAVAAVTAYRDFARVDSTVVDVVHAGLLFTTVMGFGFAGRVAVRFWGKTTTPQ